MGTQTKPVTLLRDNYFASPVVPIFARRSLVQGVNQEHDHEFLEVALILRGTGTHLSIHGRKPLKTGDGIVLRPGAWHAYEQCRNLEVFNCCLGPELFQRDLGWTMEDPGLHALLWAGPLEPKNKGILSFELAPPSLQRCRRHLDKLAQLQQQQDRRVERLGWLVLFLAELAQVLRHTKTPPSLPSPHPAVERVKNSLHSDIAKPWHITELAHIAGINTSYLIRLFKRHTGLPPLGYLARHRAERAAQLLLLSPLSIGQIAAAVGWDDPNLFARRFRSYFGMAARDYRQRFRRQTPSENAT